MRPSDRVEALTVPPLSLSVIIVTYNSALVIAGAIDSVRLFLPGAEIVVVDNDSRDATLEIVSARGADRIVTGHGNVGFGGGVNRGARVARGTLLLVINPDATVTAVERSELLALSAQSAVGIRRCRLLEPGRGDRPLGQRWGPLAELGWIFTWFLKPREINIRRPRLWRRGVSEWVHGAAFVVSRSEFLALAGFDERLFLYFEDFELSRRYASHGFPVARTGSVTVAHAGQGSSGRDEDRLMACALLSLIQYADSWEGGAAAERVASSALRGLAMVGLIGRLLRHIPWVGRRAARKALSADTIRESLIDTTHLELPLHAYGEARRALAVAQSRVARTGNPPGEDLSPH